MVVKTFREHILRRRFKRRVLYGTKLFKSGDIVSVEFESGGYFTRFKGICIRKNRKLFLDINSTYLLRNIILGAGVELHVPVYLLGNNFFIWKLHDYARKKYNYRASKLYFLRSKLNRASLVEYKYATV